MPSAYIVRKFTNEFETLDVDNDGFVSKADFERIASNLASALGLEPGSAKSEAIHGRYTVWWEGIATRDKDGDGRVDLAEWLDYDQEITSSPETFQQVLEAGADELFQILDFDDDGVVSLEEYTTWIGSYGVSDVMAKEAFAHLAASGSGRLSRAETRERVREYYQSEDPESPGNWLFGRRP
jgi:Ca2+-binding EF-hand superfamily protein